VRNSIGVDDRAAVEAILAAGRSVGCRVRQDGAGASATHVRAWVDANVARTLRLSTAEAAAVADVLAAGRSCGLRTSVDRER
jgi:hypothetical protein